MVLVAQEVNRIHVSDFCRHVALELKNHESDMTHRDESVVSVKMSVRDMDCIEVNIKM